MLQTLNSFTYQIRTHCYKSKSRRFLLDDKILAPSIYQQSSKTYLAKIFSFPSPKILRSLLNGIPLTAGLNEHVFKRIKIYVVRLKSLEEHCTLIFDETIIAS